MPDPAGSARSDPDKCGCRGQFPHVAGEVATCMYAPLVDAVRRAETGDGWCREHDEREPCQVCGVRRAVNSARDHIPTVGYDHSLCGADPCSDCR